VVRKKLFVVFLFLLFLVASFFLLPFEKSGSERIRGFVSGWGVFAPVVFVAVQIFQVLFFFVPGQVTGFAGGYLFGAVKGTVYTMIGILIGSWIAFSVSRKLGRPFVEKKVSPALIARFDFFSERRGEVSLFLVYLFPALPDNAASFVAGLTGIPLGRFLFISFLGRLPGLFMLNLVGSGFAGGSWLYSAVLFSGLAVVSFVFYLARDGIERFVRRVSGRE